MLEVGKVISYKNKEYVIVKLKELYNIKYAFLTNVDDETDFFFGKFVDDKLIEITDGKFINLLLQEME
jgi:hypothetical protein